jgi:hypothetical protein
MQRQGSNIPCASLTMSAVVESQFPLMLRDWGWPVCEVKVAVALLPMTNNNQLSAQPHHSVHNVTVK